MTSIRRLLAAVLSLAALAACTQSNVDPNARIDITGSLHRQSGVAVKGARIALAKGPDVIDVISTMTTLGLACLTDELPNACHDARITETTSDGTFAYQLKGRDTQGAFGNASTLELSAHLPRGGEQLDGAALSMKFQVQTQRLNLPLRFWEPKLKVAGDEREASASWSAVPANILPPQASLANIDTSLRFARGTERVWTFALGASGARFDPRYLEDSTGSVAVVAEQRGIPVGDSFGRNIDVMWRSARFPYVSPIGAPVSRGAPCFVTDSRRRPISQSGCRVTNGVFDDGLEPHTAQGDAREPNHRAVYLDLGRPDWITLVVVRECGGRCSVEVSNNARKWQPVGSGTDSQAFVAVAPPANTRARYVRVKSAVAVDNLAEVSVWNRTRPKPVVATAGDSLLTSLETAKQEPLSGGGGGGFPLKPVLLVLAALGIAGGAFALGRARRA